MAPRRPWTGVGRTPRRTGEAARLSRRARGGGGGAASPAGRRRCRGGGARGYGGHAAARRLHHETRGARRRGRLGRRIDPDVSRRTDRAAAGVHGARRDRHTAHAAAHGARQGESPRAADAGCRDGTCLSRAAHADRRDSLHHLRGGARRSSGRSGRRLLRARRPLDERHGRRQRDRRSSRSHGAAGHDVRGADGGRSRRVHERGTAGAADGASAGTAGGAAALVCAAAPVVHGSPGAGARDLSHSDRVASDGRTECGRVACSGGRRGGAARELADGVSRGGGHPASGDSTSPTDRVVSRRCERGRAAGAARRGCRTAVRPRARVADPGAPVSARRGDARAAGRAASHRQRRVVDGAAVA